MVDVPTFYKVDRLRNGTYAVEVDALNKPSTRLTGFRTALEAENWIAVEKHIASLAREIEGKSA